MCEELGSGRQRHVRPGQEQPLGSVLRHAWSIRARVPTTS